MLPHTHTHTLCRAFVPRSIGRLKSVARVSRELQMGFETLSALGATVLGTCEDASNGFKKDRGSFARTTGSTGDIPGGPGRSGRRGL